MTLPSGHGGAAELPDEKHRKLIYRTLATSDVEAIFLASAGMANMPKARRAGRPFVLIEAETRGIRWTHPLFQVAAFLSGDWEWSRWQGSKVPTTAEERRKLRAWSASQDQHKHLTAHFGSWDSIAGSLVEAMQPVSRCQVREFLAVRRESLEVIHVNTHRRHPERTAEFAQLAWSLPRKHLKWTRDVTEGKPPRGYQIGFDDGSWTTLWLHAQPHLPAFRDIFPGTLPQTSPIPDA
ncbi:hypothetical protein [Streptomyces blattellae]|uniref:hypothetical protein n=1 Tax=Streptomyces blattellae TaxID=2569855 RepID=UPI0012B7D897|nr:hypothetical protein [Streptomyces blattellae]